MRDSLLTKLAAVPILAIFLGAAILAGKVALAWTPEDTRLLLGSLIAICGASLAILSIVLGLFLGAAVYRRLAPGQKASEMALERPAYPSLAYREPQPPLLTSGDRPGRWLSNGPDSYDLWEDEEPIEIKQSRYQ